MSELKDNSITIYEALQHIKNRKYVMPAFQRQFVWSMEQIEKLWDSILQGYPISTFLFWYLDDSNVTQGTCFCDFLRDIVFKNSKDPVSKNYNLSKAVGNDKIAVLDGQQRLTSLYLSLYGTVSRLKKYARTNGGERNPAKLLIELDRNKIETGNDGYYHQKYGIKFITRSARTSPTQFEIKNIITEEYLEERTRKVAIEKAIENVPPDSKDYARDILYALYNKVFEKKLIRYIQANDMKQDDALEMFVRFNSGGKPLKKSEITMSILADYWPSAKTEVGNILMGSYADTGFGTDFIIRAALMLYGDVAKSYITPKMAGDLKKNWDRFKDALKNLEYLLEKMKMKVSDFSSSWNVLLPILYCVYYDPKCMDNRLTIRSYLFRAIFFTYFSSGTTTKLQKMKSYIIEDNNKITVERLEDENELRLTDAKIEDLLRLEKGDRVAKEVLKYLSIEWNNEACKYELDHLHPSSEFNDGFPPSHVSMDDWEDWRRNRDRIPNLHYLEGISNAHKSNMPLAVYCEAMSEEQLERFNAEAMIPHGVSLKIENFGDFYEARKNILAKKIKALLG